MTQAASSDAGRFTIAPRTSIAAGSFAPSNIAIGAPGYDYEGTWAFCRMQENELPGLRFGFGRGTFAWGDIAMHGGFAEPMLVLRIEAMAKEGAYLWHTQGQLPVNSLRADGTQLSLDRDGCRLEADGWPDVHWVMGGADGSLWIDMTLSLQTVMALPDWLLPNSQFSMWLASGTVRGEVTWSGVTRQVHGTVFLDHPRTNVRSYDVGELDWYLYTPLALDSGMSFVSFHTAVIASSGHKPNFNFSALMSGDGAVTWFDDSQVIISEMDGDNKPSAWVIEAVNGSTQVHAEVTAKSSRIVEVRDSTISEQDALDRSKNENIPLLLDGTMHITEPGASGPRRDAGTGLGEFVARR